MQNKSIALGGLFIGSGLIIAGLFLYWGLGSLRSFDRTVNVKGLSEIEMPADKVIWPIMYTEQGDDLAGLYNTIETKNAVIVKFLASNGIAPAEITTSAPAINDSQAERYYGGNRPPYRYYATSVVTVSSGQVDKVRELMVKQTELLKKGIAIGSEDYRYQTQFLFTRLNDVKPKMIEEATKNARASAEKFAEDSGSKLGKIRSAYQGQLSIEDRDANTPYIKRLRVVTTIEYQLRD